MKHTIRTLGLVGTCCTALLGLPQLGQSQNFYVDANAGVALADDVDLRQFLVSTRGTELDLDPGARLSVAGGYNFCPTFGIQLETGFIHNSVDGSDGDMSFGHVPLLADVVFRYDQPDCKWVPYAGAGAGGDLSIISLDHVRAPNGAVVDGSDSDIVFAWQLFAGLRYKINDKMSVGGGYKFYSANGARWDVEDSFGDIRTGRAQVHSIGVDFNFKF